MLDLHQRAAHLPTEPPLTWLHFVLGRFLGEVRERWQTKTVGLTLQAATQNSESTAEVRGLFEISANGALPVVYDCSGTLNLATQELSLEDSRSARYEGRFSENGRVVSLTRHDADGKRSKPFHLIESGTLGELL